MAKIRILAVFGPFLGPMFGPIFWTHLGGKRDTLVTRWQYGFFLWVERITGEWNGLISQRTTRTGWKHASTDVNAMKTWYLRLVGSWTPSEAQQIFALEAFEVFVGWL